MVKQLQFQTHAIDTSSVIEAHGLLTSLLLENELPPHVVDTLKRVARILDPSPTTGIEFLGLPSWHLYLS